MAKVITDARMGPTHGVQSNPSEAPTTAPPAKPVLVAPLGANLEKKLNSFSKSFWKAGISNVSPKVAITITETVRSELAEILVLLTIVDKKRVKKVKLRMKPVTTPHGLERSCRPPILDDKTIGKTGRMQGDRTVMIPAIKANKMSRSIKIWFLLTYYN